MSSAKAQAQKEKGNASFKAGNYVEAIGHYTDAILSDRNDFTFPLNRAACYLKLGKNEDAERDCTTVLKLNPSNAKALFRRGQARLATGKLEDAVDDLTQGLKREPSNNAIKDELKKATEALSKKKGKTSSKPAAPLPSSAPSPQRRRVPIKIIDPNESSTSGISPQPTTKTPLSSTTLKPSTVQPAPSVLQPNRPNTLEPISTRSLKAESSTTPKTTSTPPVVASSTPTASHTQPEQPQTFKDAKQARETSKPSRIGGGIFRANGESTIFATRHVSSPSPPATTSPSSSAPASIVPVTPENAPKTWFDFNRAWDSEPSTAVRWGLILSIPPSNIPALFKISLEPALLTSILTVFLDVLKDSGADSTPVKDYMNALGQVERFGTVILFLSRKEKTLARSVWEALSVNKAEAAKFETPSTLAPGVQLLSFPIMHYSATFNSRKPRPYLLEDST
ncbi:hypothetical protein H0H93_009751 [Arthromyces matolae]|nr:hypothetical protein H0H93_009751 [Arthromyces matolae]